MISVAIIHCPLSQERVENMRALCEALPGAVVVEDRGDAVGARLNRRGCWPIARRAWEARLSFDRAFPPAQHHLVLEDDAQICAGFSIHLIDVVQRAPLACVSLFHGDRDCSVATVMPSFFVAMWLDWCATAKLGARHLPHHDYLLTQGMRALGVPHLRTEPSLVEHGRFASLLDHPHVRATRFEQSPQAVALVERNHTP